MTSKTPVVCAECYGHAAFDQRSARRKIPQGAHALAEISQDTRLEMVVPHNTAARQGIAIEVDRLLGISKRSCHISQVS
ncbi:hypothetical protein CcI49_11125 [Frankia sp. CcI49]|nr:hypothetical protein ACG83_24120 [Frankia sp. R43]ONH60597.1 hypothetical protein CcI49_11125 [Frankia sp. CcI49]